MLLTKSGISVTRVEASRLAAVDFDNLPFGAVFSDHMLSAEYRKGQWQEPAIVPYGPIPLPPSLSALHYGQCFFEGFKAFRQVDGGIALFRIRDNFARFNQSAARLAMPEIPASHLIEGIIELIRVDHEWVPRSKGASLYIRPLCFACDETLFVRPSGTYRFIVLTCPVGQYFAEPLHLLAEERYVRAFPGGTGATKAAGNYAGSLLAARLAQENGFHSVIWLDGITHRFVEECGLMNIFFVIDGVAITPPLGGTILAGITRDSVIVLLHEMGIDVVERAIALDEVAEAAKNQKLSEAFGVGTAATIAPIESIRYRDSDIRPATRKESSLAAGLLARLEAIRTGQQRDKYGWLLKI
jgi:branched-chain amino acid aminotransferase